MKRNCSVLTPFCVVCILLVGIYSQSQAAAARESVLEANTVEKTIATSAEFERAESDVNGPAPKIIFDKVVHDFGEIDPASKNVCEFKFTNEGEGILKVKKKIKSTCGCTVPTLSKEEYAFGESGTIKVTYRSGKGPGKASKHLYVSSNDPNSPKVTLTIKADIVKKLDYKPQKLNLLLDKENAACPEIEITALDDKIFSIKKFKSVPDCITAEFDPQVKAKSFVLQPKVDLEKLDKTLNGSITISLTHPQYQNITISFSVLPKFKAEPPILSAFKAEPLKPIEKTVYVLSNYDEEFEIESVSSKNGIVKILSQEKIDKNRCKIDLEIVPPEKQGKKRHFEDTLSINIAGGEKLDVRCIGAYSLKKAKKPQADKK